MATALTPSTTNINNQNQPTLWRVSVARYHEMIACGAFTENDRVELLEGYIVEKMPIKPSHRFTTNRIRNALAEIIGNDYFILSQQPLTTEDSEPEPDVFVVRGNERDFISNHPGPQDVPLVVEGSDTTLAYNIEIKKRIYAQAAIAVYWIVNLQLRQIQLFSSPTGPAQEPTYQRLETYQTTDQIPVVVDGNEVGKLPVADLLP